MSESQARMSRLSEPDSEGRVVQDRSLMERIHSGDPAALDIVLARYWAPLVSYAKRLLPDEDAAEDVVQETMLRVWRLRAQWTPTQRLRGFLYQITRNLALNERKKDRVRTGWEEKRRREPQERAPSPIELLERTELRALLDQAIEELPAKRREVFVLSRYHGHTYREIAEIMDVSPQTVANQMSAALDELRQKLRPQLDAFLVQDGAQRRSRLRVR